MISTIWDFAKEVFSNNAFIAAILGVVISQILKIVYYFFKERKINLRYLASSGGFPSSHAATVTALTLTIGLQEGFSSNFFIISIIFSCIVMYDAAGVRQAAGDQAKLLNKIINKLLPEEKINEENLKELIGHKPLEVLAGAIIGFFTAILVNFYL